MLSWVVSFRIRIALVLWVWSHSVKLLFYQSVLSAKWVVGIPCLIFEGIIVDCDLAHLAQLPSINTVPV